MNHEQLTDAILTLKEVAKNLPLNQYQNVTEGSLVMANGETFEEAYADLHNYFRKVTEVLGIDFEDVGYTFRIVNKLDNKQQLKQHVNLPNVRMISGVACLCWGSVQRPVEELAIKPLAVERAKRKPEDKPSFVLEFRLSRAQLKAMGGNLQFGLAVDSSKEVTTADIDACIAGELKWSEILRETSGSGNGDFSQGLGSLFGDDMERIRSLYLETQEKDSGLTVDEVFPPVTVKVIDEPIPGSVGGYDTIQFHATDDNGVEHYLWTFAKGFGERVQEGCQFDVYFTGVMESKKKAGQYFAKTSCRNLVSANRLKHGTASLVGMNFETTVV